MIDSKFYASTVFLLLFQEFFFQNGIFQLLKRISGSDIGFLSRENIIKIGSDDLKASSKYLGNKHYFHGFKPTKVSLKIERNPFS